MGLKQNQIEKNTITYGEFVLPLCYHKRSRNPHHQLNFGISVRCLNYK